jgi:hypothetical protein
MPKGEGALVKKKGLSYTVDSRWKSFNTERAGTRQYRDYLAGNALEIAILDIKINLEKVKKSMITY